MKQPSYLYSAIVTNVVDGDTIDCTVDLGFNTFSKERFRLYGIDTPEKTDKNVVVRELAIKATEFVKFTIGGKSITIESLGKDKYGRWLAKIHLSPDQPTINEQLVSLGLARAYFGDSKATVGWDLLV